MTNPPLSKSPPTPGKTGEKENMDKQDKGSTNFDFKVASTEYLIFNGIIIVSPIPVVFPK